MGHSYVQVINAQIITDASMAANVTSSVVDMTHKERARAMFEYSIQAIWSSGSSPVGTLKIQASIDGSTFVDISGTVVGVTGNSGSVMWNVEGHSYKFLQLVYTRSSGSGTLNAYFNGKAHNI